MVVEKVWQNVLFNHNTSIGRTDGRTWKNNIALCRACWSTCTIKIGPIRFLAGCRKLSILRLFRACFCVFVLWFRWATFLIAIRHCVCAFFRVLCLVYSCLVVNTNATDWLQLSLSLLTLILTAMHDLDDFGILYMRSLQSYRAQKGYDENNLL